MTMILVIEDEEMIRHNLFDLLQAEEFDVLEAANGKEGLKLAKMNHPDLIVCDIMMPDLNGYEVLEELQHDPETAIIPFIFLTAKTELDDRRQGMDLGADDFLTKPCTPQELLKAIDTRLEKQALHTQRYQKEHQRAEGLEKKTQTLQQISLSRENILQQFCQDLRDPLSNMTMAIEMLKRVSDDAGRDRYLTILQQECTRQKTIINQLSELQDFLTPDNVRLLKRMNQQNSDSSR